MPIRIGSFSSLGSYPSPPIAVAPTSRRPLSISKKLLLHKLLHANLTQRLSRINGAIRAHGNCVTHIKLPACSAEGSPFGNNFSLQIELSQYGTIGMDRFKRRRLEIAPIDYIKKAVRSDIEIPGAAQCGLIPLLEKSPIGIKNLDTFVGAVRDIDPPVAK